MELFSSLLFQRQRLFVREKPSLSGPGTSNLMSERNQRPSEIKECTLERDVKENDKRTRTNN